MPRPQAPCGTDSAYRRHLRKGEPVDAACQAAHNDANQSYRQSPTSTSSRRFRPAPVDEPSRDDTGEDPPESPSDDGDDMKLIVDTLRDAFKLIAAEDPTKLAPIAREFRSAVEAARGPVEAPKEMTLAEQLNAARAARAARAQGQVAPA